MATIGANGKTLLETTATRVRTASRPPGPTPHQTTPSAGNGFRLNRCISSIPMSSRKRVVLVPKRAMASPRIPVKDFGDRLFSLSHPRPDRGSSVFVLGIIYLIPLPMSPNRCLPCPRSILLQRGQFSIRLKSRPNANGCIPNFFLYLLIATFLPSSASSSVVSYCPSCVFFDVNCR